MNTIHPTALVEEGVELDGVTVGPMCVVRRGVKIKKGTVLHAQVYLDGDTELGEGCQVFPFASIGAAPQDLKYKGEPSRVRIGNGTIIRESVTIHRGTEGGGMETKVGNRVLIMATAHVAHDCRVGDNVIIGNGTLLAGHVEVQQFAILSGLCAVHQFSRIGTKAYLSGGTMVGMDVPPFCTADGRRAGLAGVNTEGLKRHGYDNDRLASVKRIYKDFYRPGTIQAEALAAVDAIGGPDAKTFADFVRSSQRGVLRPRGDDANE